MLSRTTNLNKIMLIDDSEVDLKINTKILSLHYKNSEIITCLSAELGLSYIKKHLHQIDQLPELILLDIQMPDMDGFGFLEIFKNFPAAVTDHCSIVILSSTLDFGDIKRAEANRFVLKLLRKPLNPAELKAALS